MDNKLGIFFPVVLFSALLFTVMAFLIPWNRITWGKLQYAPAETVTVTGEAKQEQNNQVGTFSAGVSAIEDDKQKAVDEMNKQIKAITEALKNFGIPAKDIKTQNLNIYQQEEMYYDNGIQKSRPGQWRVNNTMDIKLRDLSRANELTDLLSASGATNVYGPNFTIEDTKEFENTLLESAMKDAKAKAGILAKTSGKNVGKVLSINEGMSQGGVIPLFDKGIGAGGGGAALEPGTQTVSKTVTVTFELR